ncbi:MAG: hypothetical protein AB9903_17980 [Vulcanimicrobiota bacterium]
MAEPSDTDSVEVDDDMVVIGDVKQEDRKSRPLFASSFQPPRQNQAE